MTSHFARERGATMCINPTNPIELGILLIVVGLAVVGLVHLLNLLGL